MSDCIIIQGSLTLYDGDVVRITHVDDIASGSVGSMSVSCAGHNAPGGYVYGEQSLPAWTGGDGAVVSYQIKIVNVGGPGCEGEISVEGRGDVQTRVITEPKIYYEARLAGRTPAVVSCDGGTETASCLLFKVTEWRDTSGGVQTDLESTGVTGSVSHTFSKNTGLAVSCPETTTLSAPDGTSVNFTYTFRQEAVKTEVTISDVTADADGNIGARDGIVVKKGDIADPPTNVGANWGGKLAYKTRNVYCLYTGKCLGYQRVWVPPKMSGGGGNGKPSVTPGGDSGGNGGGGSGGGGSGGSGGTGSGGDPAPDTPDAPDAPDAPSCTAGEDFTAVPSSTEVSKAGKYASTLSDASKHGGVVMIGLAGCVTDATPSGGWTVSDGCGSTGTVEWWCGDGCSASTSVNYPSGKGGYTGPGSDWERPAEGGSGEGDGSGSSGGAPDPEKRYVLLGAGTTSRLVVAAAGGIYTAYVNASGVWRAECGASFLSFPDGALGENSAAFRFRLDPNTSGRNRATTVVFTLESTDGVVSNATATLYVTQSASTTLTPPSGGGDDPGGSVDGPGGNGGGGSGSAAGGRHFVFVNGYARATAEIGSEGGEISVPLRRTAPVTRARSADWLAWAEAPAALAAEVEALEETFTFTVAPNASGETRTATLTLALDEAQLPEGAFVENSAAEIIVTQYAAEVPAEPSFDVDPAGLTFPAGGGEKELRATWSGFDADAAPALEILCPDPRHGALDVEILSSQTGSATYRVRCGAASASSSAPAVLGAWLFVTLGGETRVVPLDQLRAFTAAALFYRDARLGGRLRDHLGNVQRIAFNG